MIPLASTMEGIMTFVVGVGIGFLLGAGLCTASFLWVAAKD
jgi:hypothetical protein